MWVIPYVYLCRRALDESCEHVYERVCPLGGQAQARQTTPTDDHTHSPQPKQAFSHVVDARAAILRRHGPLYFSTYFFDYLGAVVNYAGKREIQGCVCLCV